MQARMHSLKARFKTGIHPSSREGEGPEGQAFPPVRHRVCTDKSVGPPGSKELHNFSLHTV